MTVCELTLFEDFPREIGRRKKWCNSIEEYHNYLSVANGSEACYCSIYRQTMRRGSAFDGKIREFGSADPIGAFVNKIYLDFDCKFGYEAALLLHEKLMNATPDGLLHRINFSGRTVGSKAVGFHFYLFVHPNMRFKKGCVRNFQQHLEKKLREELAERCGVRFVKLDRQNPRPDYELAENELYELIDNQIIGDILRISRITDTWNPKRRKYCIPVNEELLYAGPETIAVAADRPQEGQMQDIWLGRDIYSIPEEYDKDLNSSRTYLSEVDVEPNFEILDKTPFPNCIRKLMGNPFLEYERRYWLMVAFRDSGILKKECYDAMSKIMHPNWFRHIIEPTPGEDMIERIYGGTQQGAVIPGCERWREYAGMLVSDCRECSCLKRKHPIYW